MRSLSLALLIICLLWNGIRSEEGVPESCEGLDNIGKARVLDCERTPDCLSQICNVSEGLFGHGATLLLFPCDQPPALEILLNSPEGSGTVGKFDSSTPSRTTGVPLNDQGFQFQITVVWATPRTASIMGEIVNPNKNFRTSLLDATNVTLPACRQTPEPTFTTTCLALRHIAVNAGKTSVTCTTDSVDNCDTISCTVQLSNTTPVHYKLQVLPCNKDTPAIHILVKRNSGDDNGAINQVLTRSKEVPVFQNTTLDVTLKQLDGAIGLQVDLLKDRIKIEELFSYSEIPINETQCTGGKMRADPVLKGSPAPSGGSPLELIPWQLVLFSALLPPLYSLL